VSAPEIDRRIDAMTPDQKIGQLLLVSFDGTAVNTDLQKMLTRWGVGGVVLYERHIKSVTQTRQLTTSIRRLSGSNPVPFIAIDHEGGTVMRLRRGVPALPGNMALGATGSEQLAFVAGKETAKALRSLGFTMNFAPVLDVYGNPESAIGTRSFGDRPALVAALGSAFVEGQSAEGVISVAKHFVGEGEAGGDSHDSSPSVSRSLAEIEASDLVPFRSAIAHGLPAVMTSHVAAAGITSDGELPVTLSHTALTGLLRGKLGFDGLVITDALEMKSLLSSPEIQIGEVAVKAIEAGADMVLVPGSPTDRRLALESLSFAYASGRISEDRLRASLRRILRTKEEFAVGARVPPSSRSTTDVAGQIAEQSITVIADPGHLLGKTKLTDNAVYVGPAGALSEIPGLRHVILPRKIAPGQLRSLVDCALAALGDARTIIGAAENRHQADVLRLLSARSNLRFVAISLGNPHDLEGLTRASVVIAAYSTTAASQRSAASVLLAQTLPPGVLPIALPGFGVAHSTG
jgi:beta-N-acetylhexosaminidase